MFKKTILLASFFIALTASAADRVLYIGDSHTDGTFGHELNHLLRTTFGNEVATIGSCGSAPIHWNPSYKSTYFTKCGYYEHILDAKPKSIFPTATATPKLEVLLPKLKPTIFIAALGANAINSTNESIQAQVSEMINTVRATGAKCIWVGPPNNRNNQIKLPNLYIQLEKAAHDTGCEFVDSRPFTHYPEKGGDGSHFDSLGPEGKKIAKEWASGVFAEVKKILGI